jgi:hypothetical protein
MDFEVINFSSESNENKASNLKLNSNLKYWSTSGKAKHAFIIVQINKEETEEISDIEISILII